MILNVEPLNEACREVGICPAEEASLLREVSGKCERVIEKLEAGETRCWDFRATRQATACLAWDMMEKRQMPWSESLRQAWHSVKDKCSWRE